jgi:tRNA threonylcarbamoyladenosine biosynthesis protein TsaB
MSTPADGALLLALDTGSPVVSVAVGARGRVLAERAVDIARSAELLLEMIDQTLAAAGAGPRDLGGVIALRGPGSFTGLRVGLATALGLHDALGIAAAALPTHLALAAAAPAAASRIAAAVDALRGEWFVETFAGGDPPRSLAPPAPVAAAALGNLDVDCLIGFGLGAVELPDTAPARLTPPPLAPAALALAWRGAARWSADELVHPLYLREPATTPPRR